MLDRVQFVNEMKKALDLPDSCKLDIEELVFPVTTDEILDPEGFDLQLGLQDFHFNLRTNKRTNDDLSKLFVIPERTKNEVNAVLRFISGNYKGTREIFEKGYTQSNYCRICLGIDYALGRDGSPTFMRTAIELIRKNNSDYLEYIKDKKLRAHALFLIGKSSYYDEERESFYKLATELDESDTNYLFTYATFLYNKSRRKDSFPYYRKAADLGNEDARFITGVLYALGLDQNNNGKSRGACNWRCANEYLNKCNNPDRFAYISQVVDEWELWGYGNWNLWEKSCEVQRKGADLGYAICYYNLAYRYQVRADDLYNNYKKKEALTWYNKAYSLFQLFYSGKWPSLLSWYYSQIEAFNKTRLYYLTKRVEEKKKEVESCIEKCKI